MNRMIALFGGVILVAGLGVAVYAHDEHDHKTDGKPTSVQGELVDAGCFVSDGPDSKGKGHAKCAANCMASGVPAGILPDSSKDGSGMLFLLTNPTVLAHYAGQKIKVEGVVHADMHAIDVKKLYVQQGDSWKEVQLKDEHHNAAGDADHAGHKHE